MRKLNKILALASATILGIGLTACGSKTTTNIPTSTPVTSTPNQTTPIISVPTTPPTTVPGTTTPVGGGKTYYTSPDATADGLGTKENPRRFVTVINELQAGDTLIMLEGTYKHDYKITLPNTQNGRPDAYITVRNDEGAKVTIDFSEQLIDSTMRGIQINANYWYFYGIDVMSAGDNGLYIAGSYNVVEYCSFHENQDSGLQIGRALSEQISVNEWPHNNLVKNCTSYNNYDYQTYGENADGFAAKLTNGEGNIFDGCIAYRNSDDGWDLYAKSDSGKVGTTIIKNCVSFENGWLLEKTSCPDESDFNSFGASSITTTAKMNEKTKNGQSLTYTTRDGDGIGFKLGGSSMEGNVVVENCLSFNNRLHGFSDNSNPKTLSLRNCTAYNNSCTPDPDTGIVGPSNTEQKSNNFDTARTEESYNNYYGLLSYTTNQTVPGYSYSNADAFRGSVGYSIFCLGKNKYTSFKSYTDASSYDSKKIGTAYNNLSDNMFESVEFGYTVNGNRDFHTLLRNKDGSVNMGSFMNIIGEELLNFCGEGKQIGAKLNYSSDAEYDHYYLTDFTDTKLSQDEIMVQHTADVLEIMCNPNAVYQNVDLLTMVNNCKITWESSNELVLKCGEPLPNDPNRFIEYSSTSGVTHIAGVVYRDRNEDKQVTLTATITYNDATITKDFVLNVKKDIPEIGTIVGFEDRYILTLFQDYTIPMPSVLNGSSYYGLTLIENQDYVVNTYILYAASSADFESGNFYEISKVYTSMPGVYKVVYEVESLISQETLSTSFFAYVVSEDANIDFVMDANNEPELEVNVSRDGVQVYGKFTNILGKMYVSTTEKGVTLSKDELIQNGKVYDITDETLTAVYPINNDHEYDVHVLVTNKNESVISDVYSRSISVQTVNSEDEFFQLVNGETNSTTIYLLTRNLNYEGYTWKTNDSQVFGGLFNGNGYTISNITINGTGKKDAAIFYKLRNGTIMNVNFENINIQGLSGVATIAGIVGQMTGGYIHHIGLKNITVYAHTGAGAMVGQISGGVNYITQVELINEENVATITVSNKYCGGVVGNVQKDTDQDKVEAYLSDCHVKGTIGHEYDAGGYVGGIVGRCKNDYSSCVLEIEKCFFEGTIMTGKNYAGGIFAGSDNGAGLIRIIHCVSNVSIYYAGSWIDGISVMSHKNGSPIYGRYTKGEGTIMCFDNYANFADSQIPTDIEEFSRIITTSGFWGALVDIENVWIFNEETLTVSLRNPQPKETE